jgi:hypothetical protein
LSDLDIDLSVTRNAAEPVGPVIDEAKVDTDRKQWHASDLGDRKLPIW